MAVKGSIMNRVQSFARVIIGAMAIFFSVKVVVMGIAPVAMLLNGVDGESLWSILVSVLVSLAALALLQYFGILKPQKIVDRVTSNIESQTPTSPISWLPAGYRLVCLFAGLYCIYSVLSRAVTQVALYSHVLADDSAAESMRSYLLRPEDVATTVILLVLGVYLLVGAPHFVRWHLKKTARFCQENAIE